MNYSASITLIDERVRVIDVKFVNTARETPKICSYKSLDPNIGVGDLVVVPALYQDGKSRFSVAEVVGVDGELEIDSKEIEYKWVVQRVNMSDYNDVLIREKAAIDILRKADRKQRRINLAKTLIDATVIDDVRNLLFIDGKTS